VNIVITRRDLVLCFSALASAGVAVAYWASLRNDDTLIDIALPQPGSVTSPSLEIFEALSRIVLAREKLDEHIARHIYGVMIDEPWGPKHMSTAYAELRTELLERRRKIALVEKSLLLALGRGELWFVMHVITTWYLGIYYHEQRPTQRITFEGALMHEAVRGYIPTPYVESVGFGAWTRLPAVVSEPGH
jgi:Membrane bound FAD containing D-sorbitol dehydrogenase